MKKMAKQVDYITSKLHANYTFDSLICRARSCNKTPFSLSRFFYYCISTRTFSTPWSTRILDPQKPVSHSSSKVSDSMFYFGRAIRPFFLWKTTPGRQLSTKMLLKDVKIKQYCKFRFSQQSLSSSSETSQMASNILIYYLIILDK